MPNRLIGSHLQSIQQLIFLSNRPSTRCKMHIDEIIDFQITTIITVEWVDIGIYHDKVCTGVVGIAIDGTASVVLDSSTNHNSTDCIRGQFLPLEFP